MATTPKTLGERVKHHRKEVDISVEKLRDRVMTLVPARYVPGVKTFYRIESGERLLISPGFPRLLVRKSS